MTNRNRRPIGPLYAIVSDSHVALAKWPDAAQALAAASIPVIQLRSKSAADRDRLDAARAVARCLVADRYPGLLIINDRVDIAAILAAEVGATLAVGLHLGQDDLLPVTARAVVGDEMVIGMSTHDIDQVCAVDHQHVDYLGFGPVFDTATKRAPDPTVGLARLTAATAATTLPIVAIGGLNVERGRLALEAGAASVAMVSGLTPDAESLETLTDRARAIEEALTQEASA